MKEEYKEAVITYSEHDNTWRDEESGKCHESLKKAKESINRRRAKDLKFDPIDVFICKYDGDIRKATITSIINSKCVWIKYKDEDKSREKFSFDYGDPPYATTKENEALVTEIKDLHKNIDTLERAVKVKTNSLKPVDMSILVKDEEGTDA
jgi:hypothetical protein